jgi:hypothetical protein
VPTLIVRHTVKDFDVWKPIYQDHEAMRQRYGISESGLYRDVEKPNDVVLVFRVEDIERAREFGQTADLRDAMQRAGVVSEPSFWLLEDA